MALTNQPYLPLYVQDWISNNKLKLCSPGAHGIMINVMCLMHKEDTYGKILLKQKYKQNESNITNFALMLTKLLPFDFDECCVLLRELIDENILKFDGDFLVCERMVKDAELSKKRSESGSSAKNSKKIDTSSTKGKKSKSKIEANAENEIEIEIENKDDVLKEKKETKKDHLFSESEFIDFVKFEAQFEGTDYEYCNLKIYYEKIKNWSASGGNKKKDWIATARNFMLSDKDKGKLITKNGTKQTGKAEENFGADLDELIKNKYGHAAS